MEHRAQILSYIFLSEAQKAMDRKDRTRKQLAEEIGISASYLTQLFRGDRLLNFKTVAKIEAALNIRYEVSATADSGSNIDYVEAEKLRLEKSQLNEP